MLALEVSEMHFAFDLANLFCCPVPHHDRATRCGPSFTAGWE